MKFVTIIPIQFWLYLAFLLLFWLVWGVNGFLIGAAIALLLLI